MEQLTSKPLTQMTDDEFLRSIPLIFDEGDMVFRQTLWAQYRREANRRHMTREFDQLYNTYLNALQKHAVYADPDAANRFGFPLETDGRGRVMCTIKNFADILRNDPMFDAIYYDMLDNSIHIGDRRWYDTDDSWLRYVIEGNYHIHSAPKLFDALSEVALERKKHPVRDMIEGIEWDGKSRIYTLLTNWLKCDDTEYTREVSRLIFAGGIHRIYRPGCKYDNVPVLIGTRQGEGKTTFVRWLAMDDRFFAEVTDIDGKGGAESIEGKWICEFGELLALTRVKDQEAVKSYITRQVDHYRRAYGRRVSDIERQCIFVGTTNRAEFIADKTGGRRFFPVVVRSSGRDLYDNEQAIKADIRQCWAEAKYLFDRGKLAPVENKALVDDIRAAQADAAEEDYRVADIAEFLRKQPIGAKVCVKQLWIHALNMPDDRPIPVQDSRAIGLIMQNMPNWVRIGNAFVQGYGRPKAWQRVAPEVTK